MKYFYTFICFLLFFYNKTLAQSPFRVMWYNVENLFDTVNNPLTNDDEFTPSGDRRWTSGRYYHKLQQLAKVINTAGEWGTPALVGLCEVENDSVLVHLLRRTPLRSQHYRYCLADTDDARGIRIALLYQRDKFRFIGQKSIPVTRPGSTDRRTRHMLHVWGEIITGDTLDVILTHFPSRYGGEKESEKRRLYAASVLRNMTDSLCLERRDPYFLIMGDFNDTPTNRSLKDIISAKPLSPGSFKADETDLSSCCLYNMIPFSINRGVWGTHKYQGEWAQLDHLIVNGSFLFDGSVFQLVKNSVRIFTPDFLLTEDKTGGGIRPKRTFHGFKYEGGYSDHLPLIADFFLYLSEERK